MFTTLNFTEEKVLEISVQKIDVVGVPRYDIDFIKNFDDFNSIALTEKQLKALFYKLKYFMFKEGIIKCTTTQKPQEKSTSVNYAAMCKFLHGMTIADVGFVKNESKKVGSSAEYGDSPTLNLTLSRKNG